MFLSCMRLVISLCVCSCAMLCVWFVLSVFGVFQELQSWLRVEGCLLLGEWLQTLQMVAGFLLCLLKVSPSTVHMDLTS